MNITFDPMPVAPVAPVAPARRQRGRAALAVAVASLLCASGVVVTERSTGKDLRRVVADVIRPDQR